MKKWLVPILIVWTFLYLVPGFAQPYQKTPGVQLAIGSYLTIGPVSHSFLLKSENDGASWSLTGNIPDNMLSKNMECTHKTCVIIGNDIKASLLISHDNGISWVKKNHLGYPNAITCIQDMCVLVGENDQKPMISISQDAGETWSIKNITNVPKELTGSLNQVSCNENLCTAVGTTARDPHSLNNLPIVVASEDHGQTWSFVKKITGLPTNIHSVDNLIVKCNHHTCIVAGHYTTENFIYHMLLLASDDIGQTWKTIEELPELKNLENGLSIEDMVYSDGTFIIVGGYNKDKGFLKSLIIVSNDDGHSWSLRNISGSEFKDAGWLNSISCNDSTCVAGGHEFYEGRIYFGLTLLVSNDTGNTWSLIPYVAGTDYTPDIDKVQCLATHCIAIGNFTDNVENSHPVILLSNDRGKSWLVVHDKPDFSQAYKVKFSAIGNMG